MSKAESGRMGNFLWILLAIWFLIILLAGYIGVFTAGSPYSMSVPIPLGLCAVLPLLVFGIWFQASKDFRKYILSLNPVVLTAVHTWRIEGVVFLILCARGVLPRSFAYPAGIGDIAIGITAPLIAWMWAKRKISSGGFVLWQLAGIADLVLAVSAGLLSSLSRTGVTTQAMGLLPMSLVPTFGVPLMIILHVICIAQVRQNRRERAASPLPMKVTA